MPTQRFRPRELQKDSDLEDVRRQLNQIQVEIGRDLGTLFASRKQGEVITATTYAAAFGEVARFAPPSGGTRLILPEPNPSALDSRVTVVVEAARGPLSVEVVNGTINGASTLAFATGIGTAEFILTATGWYGWSVSLVASLPLTAIASQAADTFLANVTAGSAPPAAVNLSTLAGAGLAFGAHTLDVTGSTSITITSDQVQRAALTGEATAGANSNAVTVTRSTDFSASPWTGPHNFEGQLLLGTDQDESGTGAINVTLGDVVRLRFSDGTGNHTVGTISGASTGRLLVVEFSGTGTHTVTHSAATTDGVSCPGNSNLVITGRGGFIAVARSSIWRVLATTN